MSYPGNPSLASETRQRILGTFSQTLDLARQGRLEEAALGCDFILKMDRQFGPARELQTRLEGAQGPLEVADLAVAGGGEEAEPEVLAPAPRPGSRSDRTSSRRPLERSNALDGLPSLEGAPSLDPLPLSIELEPPPPPPPRRGPGPPVPEPPAAGQRIRELLAEGDAALERGELQTAIDAWSRIFLIDIDHREANLRIEDARRLKAEQQRQVDELMHEAVRLREGGMNEDAKATYQRVLELQPNHLAAREHLQHLDSPSVPSLGRTEGALVDRELYAGEPEVAGRPRPPTPVRSGPQRAPQRTAVAATRERSLVRVGAGVTVLLLAVAWLLYSNWGRIFANTSDQPPPPPPPNVISEASRLHLDGQTETALERLRAVAPGDPSYARAQLLIERWSENAADTAVAEVVVEVSEADRRRKDVWLEQGRRLYDQREYLQAAKAFQSAARIEPIEGPAADLYEDTKQRLLPIAQQITLFRQREWDLLLPTLWRKLVDEPQNRDVRRILIDTYYNLGVRDLRRGAPEGAAEQFAEMVGLDAGDHLAARLLLFSESYRGTSQDLLYRIFVGQLKYRP